MVFTWLSWVAMSLEIIIPLYLLLLTLPRPSQNYMYYYSGCLNPVTKTLNKKGHHITGIDLVFSLCQMYTSFVARLGIDLHEQVIPSHRCLSANGIPDFTICDGCNISA